MRDIKIYINDQLIDIGSQKDLSLKLNRSFLDLQNVDSRSGDFSYSVKLVKSKTNNSIFSNINTMQSIDKFVRTDEYKAKIYVDGIQILQGYFKLNTIDDKFYNGNFISNTISWSKQLASKNLNEIKNADGSDWKIPFFGCLSSNTAYTLSWYVDNPDYNRDVAFPFVSYGNFFAESNFTPNNGIQTLLFSAQNFPGSFYYGRILQKIFDGIGWSCDGSLFYDPEFRKLVIPYTAGDLFNWNETTWIKAQSSGRTSDIWSPSVTNNLATDFAASATFDYETNDQFTAGKRGISVVLPMNNVFQEFYNNLETYYVTDIRFFKKARTQYIAPITANYNLSACCRSLFYELKGAFNSSAPNTGYITDTTGYSNIKAGVLLLLDDGTDLDLENTVLTHLNTYLWDVSNATIPTHPNILTYLDLVQSLSTPAPVIYTGYSADVQIDIIYSGNVLNTPAPPADGVTHTYTFTGIFDFDLSIKNIPLEQNDKIKILFVSPGRSFLIPTINEVTDIFVGNLTLPDEMFYWDFKSADEEDFSINITKNLPGSSQLDFVKNFITQFNLYYTTDQDKKLIRFDKFDDFFLPNTHGYDITDKVDLNFLEPPARPVDLPSKLTIGYRNDTSDPFFIADPTYANVECINSNVFASPEKEIKLIFSATKLRKMFLYTYVYLPSQEIMVPSIANEGAVNEVDLTQVEWSYSNSLRVLKLTDYYTDTGGTVYSTLVDGYPTKLQQAVFESDSYLNLKYDGENGLYNRFYERFLNEFGDSHILTLESNINSYDFTRLQPNVPVIIKNQAYILNSISSFDPINGDKCKIELLKKFSN